MTTVSWDRPKLDRFKKALNAHYLARKGEETFRFEGNDFVPAYARYMVEFLERRFPRVTLDDIVREYEEALQEEC
jgi:hypothetical protein